MALGLAAPVVAGAPAFHEPNAVLINLTEPDLNRILKTNYRESWSHFEGQKRRVSRGVSDLSYRAELSEPVLTLGDDGSASLDLDIVNAELSLGKIERKVLRRQVSCENTRVTVEPERPADVRLGLRFAIDDDGLHVVPEELALDTQAFRLHRPSRCDNNPLPEFLMWWMGKGRLRHRLEALGPELLEKARAGAATLGGERGLLAEQWRLGDGEPIRLYPNVVDTRHGSLLIGLAGSSGARPATLDSSPSWVATHSDRSFVGISEGLLNYAIERSLSRLDGTPRRPSRGVRRLLRSDAFLALVPGLRNGGSRDALEVGLTVTTPPRIEFDTLDGESPEASDGKQALVRIRLEGAELQLWTREGEDRRWLGSAAIDEATIGLAPYAGRLGGISLEVVENEWRVSSQGARFDDELLAATFQELLFGEAFATRFAPLGAKRLAVGASRLEPRAVTRVGSYLLIGLDEL